MAIPENRWLSVAYLSDFLIHLACGYQQLPTTRPCQRYLGESPQSRSFQTTIKATIQESHILVVGGLHYVKFQLKIYRNLLLTVV